MDDFRQNPKAISGADQPEHDSTPDLLATFDSSVEREFSFLSKTDGSVHSSGASAYDGPVPTLIPEEYAKMAGSFFWWINRYRTASVTLDICYGDRESLVEPTLFYSSGKSFAPWELLSAAELPYDHSISGEWWVMSCAKMERVVTGMASEFNRHWRFLENPGEATFNRALVQREQRMASELEEQRKKHRERACSEASTAFHEKRYQDAIRLLTPFEVDEELSASARRILSMARQRAK